MLNLLNDPQPHDSRTIAEYAIAAPKADMLLTLVAGMLALADDTADDDAAENLHRAFDEHVDDDTPHPLGTAAAALASTHIVLSGRLRPLVHDLIDAVVFLRVRNRRDVAGWRANRPAATDHYTDEQVATFGRRRCEDSLVTARWAARTITDERYTEEG